MRRINESTGFQQVRMRPRPGRGSHWRRALLALIGLALAELAIAQTYQLDRASADHAGGGDAESLSYRAVLAIGQHDADGESRSASYTFSGGVFAAVPIDRVFADSFE